MLESLAALKAPLTANPVPAEAAIITDSCIISLATISARNTPGCSANDSPAAESVPQTPLASLIFLCISV